MASQACCCLNLSLTNFHAGVTSAHEMFSSAWSMSAVTILTPGRGAPHCQQVGCMGQKLGPGL
eukprot:3296128-Karenia_brevis.AAC.1